MDGKLNTLTVARLLKAGRPGQHGDGAGLYLGVKAPGAGSWLFRYSVRGRGRLMGLGPARDVTLAEARAAARDARRLLRSGTDPIEHRRQTLRAQVVDQDLTFQAAAERYIAAHGRSWKNAKHAKQWVSTLEQHVFPLIGALPVARVATVDVLGVLEPLWIRLPETATRVRGRIESVLDFAASRGWRTGENPARWRGHLANLLPARAKVAKVKHHAALPWRHVPAFMAELRDQTSGAAPALAFVILTACRTGEALGATWAEIDLANAVWSIPSERMKAGKPHRVPLSDAVLAVLRAQRTGNERPTDFVFPGGRAGRPLSQMAGLMLLRRMGRAGTTAHGFRSSFRDWAGEATNFPADVAEAALAHVRGDASVVAYARGDLFEKRRQLMAAWSAFCVASAPAAMAEP